MVLFTRTLFTGIDHHTDTVYVLLSACCHLWEQSADRGPRLTDDPHRSVLYPRYSAYLSTLRRKPLMECTF